MLVYQRVSQSSTGNPINQPVFYVTTEDFEHFSTGDGVLLGFIKC